MSRECEAHSCTAAESLDMKMRCVFKVLILGFVGVAAVKWLRRAGLIGGTVGDDSEWADAPGAGAPVVEPGSGPDQDPVHAPGHRHRGPAPEVPGMVSAAAGRIRNQPWIRTTHSDSGQRRFRR